MHIPGATAIFHKHHLDCCCEGKHSLHGSCSRRKVGLNEPHIHLESNVLFDLLDGQLTSVNHGDDINLKSVFRSSL